MLRDARTLELPVAWTYRYGFPGETDQSYARVLAQFPALHHLPPMEGVERCGEGISAAAEASLLTGVATWRRENPGGLLELVEDGDALVVLDDRPRFGHHEYVFAGDAAELLRYVEVPCPVSVLAARFGAQVHGRLADLRECGLVFTDAGTWVHVVPRSVDHLAPPPPAPPDADLRAHRGAVFRPSG